MEVLVSKGLSARLQVTQSDGFVLDVGIEIAAGESVALLGPNGAGKSTAVAAIAGLLPLDRGHLEIDGRVLEEPASKNFVPANERHFGVVFQDYLLFPHLSVLDNVAFGLRSRGVSRREARGSAKDWAERFGLGGHLDHLPDQLSGGQAQRVALARALAIEPELLLLDEPLAALDVTTRVELRREVADHLSRFAGPRLIITHDPTEAFLLADRVYVIEAGVITQVGTAEDIRLRPRTQYVADLAGSNLLAGVASNGAVSVGSHTLTVANTNIEGPVLATIHPRAIALHRTRPDGSPRNTWETTIERIEHYGDRVRLQTGEPLPLTAELTPGAVADLELREQGPVWVSIKATEVGLTES